MNKVETEENMKRMEELCNDKEVMERLNWVAKKMGDKKGGKRCICCNSVAMGMGIFLLHKSKNKEFNLKEGEERLYLYYACDEHVENGLKEVEEALKVGKNSTYVKIS